MNHQLHILYRALIDYRKSTLEDRECKLQRAAIITADSESDQIEITRRNCEVEEDWIEAIEKGLVFIEKAIKEERQFIRSNGEIIPIEKVKRTSKDSVEHLARHSDLITREPPEGQDIIPDSLYTVERLSDFTVYENRFLYMLLCYLRDFISIRYEKIVELTNTYNGKLTMNKTIVESNRRVVYQVNLEEEKKNDDYLRENNQAQAAIDRMLTIYKAVTFFLNTPLMVEVSKAPMLKPPITRTNVLKMNRNFREALSLYEYVSAYDKDGYEIKTEIKKLSPFVGMLADEIAETVELSSFLTYEYGLNVKDLFRRFYEREEERKKEEERQKFAEQLNNIRRHIEESGLTPEEYVAMLEKRIRDLEEREEDILAAHKTIDEMHDRIDALNDELRHSKEKINSLKYEIAELNRKYEEDMEAERIRHEEEIEALNEEHAQEIQNLHDEYADTIAEINAEHERVVDELNTAHAEEVNAINEKYTEEIAVLNSQHREEINDLTARHEQEVAQMEEKHAAAVAALTASYEQKLHDYEIAAIKWETKYKQTEEKYRTDIKSLREKMVAREKELNLEIDEKKDEIKDLKKKCKRLDEKKTLADARLNAIKTEYGLMSEKDVFTTKEGTDEIEHQYKVFKRFFRTEWKKTKRQIRQDAIRAFKEERLKAKGGVVAGAVASAVVAERNEKQAETMKKAEDIIIPPPTETLKAETAPIQTETTPILTEIAIPETEETQETIETVIPETESVTVNEERETVAVTDAEEKTLQEENGAIDEE